MESDYGNTEKISAITPPFDALQVLVNEPIKFLDKEYLNFKLLEIIRRNHNKEVVIENFQINIIIERYFKVLKEKYGFDLEKEKEFRKNLTRILYDNDVDKNNIFSLPIEAQNTYPLYYQIAALIKDIYRKEIGKPLQPRNISLIALRLVPLLESKVRRLKAIIVAENSDIASIISYQIKKHFPENIQILDACPPYQANNILVQNNDIDIIISSMPYEFESYARIIYVSQVFTSKDLQYIYGLCQTKINKLLTNESSLTDPG